MRANRTVVLIVAALSAGGLVAITPWSEATSSPPALIPGSAIMSEPTIDFAPDGRMFVTAPPGFPGSSPIWENVSGSWVQRFATPPASHILGGGDADLEFDSAGHAYFDDLWAGDDTIGVSADGTTWTMSPVGHYVPEGDRQWLTHFGSKYLYMLDNNAAMGLMSYRYEIGTPLAEKGALLAPLETPLLCVGCGTPPVPSVDQVTGYVFMPAWTSSGLAIYRSANSGVSYAATVLHGGYQQDGVQFAVTATDAAGNAYVVFVAADGAGHHDVYFARSLNHGATWSTPVKINSDVGTHLMPWIVAGAPGKVAVVYYTTSVVGDPNTAAFNSAQWTITYQQSLNANATTPTWTAFDLDGVYHVGQISTSGLVLNGGPDRSLGDFFSAAIKPTTGEVYVASMRTHVGSRPDGIYVVHMPAGAATLN